TILLAALCGVLFFHHLAARDLWSSHEARAAQDAQTILADGGWGLPRLFDGEVELQKPPLYYWAVAALAWCRGGAVDAWAVLLPYLAVAAGLLLKGPIAALLPAAALGTHLLGEGELAPPWRVRRWLGLGRRLGLWWGPPLVAGLALPWFVWANARTHGDLFR